MNILLDMNLLKLSHSFPFLRTLIICYYESQKRNQHSSPIISFPHLCSLNLPMVNVDYAYQFLCETKTRLPCLLVLKITYESLSMATNSFTNDATRVNCARLQSLIIYGSYVRPQNFHTYFPSCNLF